MSCGYCDHMRVSFPMRYPLIFFTRPDYWCSVLFWTSKTTTNSPIGRAAENGDGSIRCVLKAEHGIFENRPFAKRNWNATTNRVVFTAYIGASRQMTNGDRRRASSSNKILRIALKFTREMISTSISLRL